MARRGAFGFLGNISISRQFAILSVLSIATVVACLSYTLVESRAEMLTQRRGQIRNVVEARGAIVRGFVDKAKAGQSSEEAAKKMALDAIGAMRFEGTNYVFISTFDEDAAAAPEPRSRAPASDANKKRERDVSPVREPVRQMRSAPGRHASAAVRKAVPEAETWEEF